jgi:hypothetical protein
MYNLTITVYPSASTSGKVKITEHKTFQEAYHYAMGASLVVEMIWSRHCSVQTPVKHLDYYADIFNEGSIVVEKV